MCMVITVCELLMHGECCRLSAREKFKPIWLWLTSVRICMQWEGLMTLPYLLLQTGRTALFGATTNSHLEIIKLLLESGALVNKVQHCNIMKCMNIKIMWMLNDLTRLRNMNNHIISYFLEDSIEWHWANAFIITINILLWVIVFGRGVENQ